MFDLRKLNTCRDRLTKRGKHVEKQRWIYLRPQDTLFRMRLCVCPVLYNLHGASNNADHQRLHATRNIANSSTDERTQRTFY